MLEINEIIFGSTLKIPSIKIKSEILLERMSIRDRLKAFVSHLKIAELAFEMKAELSRGYVSSKSPSIGSDIIVKIKNTFPELNLIWFLTGEGDMLVGSTDNNQKLLQPQIDLGMPKVVVTDTSGDEVIPFIGLKAAAGYLQGYQDPEFIERQPTIKTPNIKGDGTYRAFEVYGQSMYPTFHHNDIVIGRWEVSLDSIRDRRVYILVTKTEGVVIKRLLNRIAESGKIIAISDNDDKLQYGNYTIDPEEILEIWYWKGAIKMEAPEPSRLYARVNNLEAQITLLTEQVSSLLKH